MFQNDNKPLAVVVIPTYNEVENVRKLIPVLFRRIFPEIRNWRLAALIVDGNSPDGTGAAVRGFLKDYAGLHLIEERQKSGIGAAYFRGFEYAMKELKADAVIEFDADFQHPPESIKSLLDKMDEGYDCVIGSRKVKGGGEPEGRNALRLFLSEFGGFLARLILFFPGKRFREVTDPTSGLRATRVKWCLDRLNLDPARLHSKKFGYKVQLLSEILSTGARYAEIPLLFANRSAGVSKFEAGTVWDILRSCWLARARG